MEYLSGDIGEEVTPVPMPNTEVKLFSADGSWGLPPARVGRRFARMAPLKKWCFFYLSKNLKLMFSIK